MISCLKLIRLMNSKRMLRSAVIVAIGLSGLLRAADDVPKQKAVVTNTEHLDLPSGAVLHLSNSIGQLSIEAWDQPGVELATIKSSKVELDPKERERAVQELGRVKITSERHGDELVIGSQYPKHRVLARPFTGLADFDLEYNIKAPPNTRLVIEHDIGQVFIDGITGDIHATKHMGDVELHLPQDEQYDIDAKVKIGAVNSDYPGHEMRKHFLGHQFVHEGSQPPHKLYLRVSYGDIVVLKIRKPLPPAPLTP
jgi:hypothetical protein